MEGTAFSIEEAGFDASLLPEDCRTPGTEAFHRAVTDYFQKSYASMGGQLSVVFAAGRIEVAWEPTAPETPAMASIGPLLQQRRFSDHPRQFRVQPLEQRGIGRRARFQQLFDFQRQRTQAARLDHCGRAFQRVGDAVRQRGVAGGQRGAQARDGVGVVGTEAGKDAQVHRAVAHHPLKAGGGVERLHAGRRGRHGARRGAGGR